MDGTMDDERRFVEYLHFTMVEDVALVIDAKQVAFVDAVKVHSERIDPKCVWLDRISNCDVSSYTLVKPEVTEYPVLR